MFVANQINTDSVCRLHFHGWSERIFGILAACCVPEVGLLSQNRGPISKHISIICQTVRSLSMAYIKGKLLNILNSSFN